MNWKETLQKLVQVPELHARFVNSLSLMEYIGCRKIVKSRLESEISLLLLTQISEEVRHAQILKKLALKLSENKLNGYGEDDTLCGKEAVEYMQSVDHSVGQVLEEEGTWTHYLLATLLIEERANLIYPFYDELLTSIGLKNVFKGILAEEKTHLVQVKKDLDGRPEMSETVWKKLRENEEKAFGRFMGAISETLLKAA